MAKKSSDGKDKKKKVKILWEDHYLEKFEEFAKRDHLSIDDFLNQLTQLMEKPGMSLAVLHERNDNSQMVKTMKENHRENTSNSRKFENHVLHILETNNTNNLNLVNENTNKMLELKTEENVWIEEIHEFLKEFIISDKGAGKDEALKIFERATQKLEEKRKAKEEEKIQVIETPKENLPKNLFIEGRVRKTHVVDKTEKNMVFCFFTLADKMDDSQEPILHNVFLWEGDLTKKLGLTDKESIIKYFTSIKVNDYFCLNGYIKHTKYKNKDGVEGTNISYNGTEVLKYRPYIKKAQ